jgi:hypothetical protein
MNQKSKLVFGTMCALLCGLCISNVAFGQDLPDGKGKADLLSVCTVCHGVDTATGTRQTKEGWTSTVYEMVQRGADGTDDQLNNIIFYLTTNFGPEQSDPNAAPQPTTPPSTPSTPPSATPPTPPSSTSGGPAALNFSEIQRVKRVIAESGSLKYPRIEQQGAHSGQALKGMGARTTNAVRAAIITPSPTRNSLVRYLGSFPSIDDNAHM